MKTNQLMQVRIGSHVIPIMHKTFMGSLTDVWKAGNSYRARNGREELDMHHWLRSPETLEYIKVVEKDVITKCAVPAHLEGIDFEVVFERDETIINYSLKAVIKSPLIVSKRGKGGGTWAHLYILLDAAARLDPEFKHMMYKSFVEGRILQWRDDSGDQFIALNAAIDAYLPERKDKDNTGIFIQCAKKLKEKINPDGDNWNTASFNQLELRASIEKDLVRLLSLGVVKNYDHLKELIARI
jgi:hypothetical protein